MGGFPFQKLAVAHQKIRKFTYKINEDDPRYKGRIPFKTPAGITHKKAIVPMSLNIT